MIKGENIILRPVQISDWESSVKWRNNFLIKKMAMMHPFPVTEDVEQEWYQKILMSKNNENIFFTIIKNDNTPIGFISLKNINYISRNCFLGIVIGEANEQKKGYGKEALKMVISYAFNTLNLLKISLEVLSSNSLAINLYSKLGFVEEGCLKSQFYTDQEFLDVYILSKFRDENLS